MPILRVKEIREMSPEERKKKLDELRTELMRIKTMIKAGGSMENTARVRELRKAIARILTIENEEKRAKEKGKR
ncbi:50S ribosomal protein L29 [Candidatus Bathyarchaeota archaeon]|nr:50S ribosomal protein L29 [Candidatus Bathyarchaeota archaeon]